MTYLPIYLPIYLPMKMEQTECSRNVGIENFRRRGITQKKKHTAFKFVSNLKKITGTLHEDVRTFMAIPH